MPSRSDSQSRIGLWFSWLIGLAAFAAVIVFALHFSEEREFVRIAEEAEPWWLSVAFVLQAVTYVGQAESWRVVTRAAGIPVPLSVAYKLSLAKLFVDQALPSGGISGTVVVIHGLELRKIPRSVVMGAVVVENVSYYAAYILTLVAALIIMLVEGHANALILTAAFFVVVFSGLFVAGALALAGRTSAGPKWLLRIPLLKQIVALVEEADPRLARDFRLNFLSTLWQLSIVALDVATMWVLVVSLGARAPLGGIYASFVISTLVRTVGIVPGGLGIYEAASVVTLKLAGIPVAVALAATLLFRGLSFWLPMVPGLVFSRGARRSR